MDLDKELQYCMGKTADLMNQYLMRLVDKGAPVRKVELLRRACTVHLGAKVDISTLEVEIPAKGPAIKAYWLKTPEGYQICLTPGLNRCWKRFALCKELHHIVIDKAEYRSTDLLPHIGEMTNEIPFETPKSPAVICEHLAEIGAMEYLMPFAVREQEASNVANGDYMPIAQKYLIPLVKVEQYLSPEYIKWLRPYAPKY